MRVVVTEEHIEKGEKGSRKCCAIALAVGECGCDDVDVGCAAVGYTISGVRYLAFMPISAVEFVRKFDMSIHLVEPIAFDLDGEEVICED
jgi:hypothetical protein